jgi:hypothetical protein
LTFTGNNLRLIIPGVSADVILIGNSDPPTVNVGNVLNKGCDLLLESRGVYQKILDGM